MNIRTETGDHDITIFCDGVPRIAIIMDPPDGDDPPLDPTVCIYADNGEYAMRVPLGSLDFDQPVESIGQALRNRTEFVS